MLGATQERLDAFISNLPGQLVLWPCQTKGKVRVYNNTVSVLGGGRVAGFEPGTSDLEVTSLETVLGLILTVD
jgi:hypothetical protein